MVIVRDKNKKSVIFFEKNINTSISDIYDLIIINRGSNKKYEYNKTDLHRTPYRFYSFELEFSDVQSGEYEYFIYDTEKNMVSSGVMRIGELEKSKEYYNKKINYEFYENKD